MFFELSNFLLYLSFEITAFLDALSLSLTILDKPLSCVNSPFSILLTIGFSFWFEQEKLKVKTQTKQEFCHRQAVDNH